MDKTISTYAPGVENIVSSYDIPKKEKIYDLKSFGTYSRGTKRLIANKIRNEDVPELGM